MHLSPPFHTCNDRYLLPGGQAGLNQIGKYRDVFMQPELPAESTPHDRRNWTRSGYEITIGDRQRKVSCLPLDRSGDHGDLRDAVPARIEPTGRYPALHMTDRHRRGDTDASASAGGASRWLFQPVAQFSGPVMGAEVRDEAKPAAQPSPAPYDGRIDEDTVGARVQARRDLDRWIFRSSASPVIRPDHPRHIDLLRRFRPLRGSLHSICDTYRYQHQKHRKQRYLPWSSHRSTCWFVKMEFESI